MNLAQSGRRVIPQQPSITSVSVIHPSKYGPPASLSRRAFTSQLPLLTLRKVLCSASVTKAAASGELLRTSPPPQTPTTLLWFKHDLRVDDHPGLHAALKASTTVIPVFCFDPKRYEQLVHSPGSASALAGAVASLRSTLRALGSDLVILTGSWEVELPQVAEAVGAEVVLAEEEIETVYRQGLERTAQALGPGVKVHTWCAPLFEASSDNYKEWKAQAGEPQIPVDPPTELPSLTTLPSNLLEKQLPPAESLLAEVRRSKAASSDPKITSSFEAGMLWARSDSDDDVSTTIISNSASRTAATATAAADEVIEHVRDEEDSSASSSSVDGSVGQQEAMEWEAEIASELATGEGPVMRALTAYLRHVETAGDGGGSAWHWRLGTAIAKFDVPWSPDGCFPALFNRALALGVVSRRRIYSEAATLLGATPEWEPAPGFLNKLAWLAASSGAAIARRRLTRKAAAAAAAVQSGEFHASMARRREGMAAHGGVIRHWRWQSVLTDYLEALPEQPLEDAPAIVLVHGFGAFGEHWRGNAAALAAKGFAVYCPTLPGYGRGEKPSMRYGQDLWRDYLAEFVATVVRRPAVLAGNSIGGFISTSMAADYPGLVDGLVLVNSAGPVQEGYRPPTEPRKPSAPPRFIVEGVSSALFSFLEGDISKQLKRMYPVAPSRADAWLTEEIARAAGDPGALGVFRSVFYLPPPRALNYLVAEVFKGPVLVLQGGKDPLNDAPKRAKEIGRLCPNARVVMVDAGHCPHDEVPHVVNAALAEFVVKDVMGRGQKARSGAQVKQAVPVK